MLRIQELMNWKDCAKAVGLSEAGIHKARTKPHVVALYEELRTAYIQEVDDLKAPFKARALEVGKELMEGAKSEAVKARMVEFFAGEAKGPAVAVQINTVKTTANEAGQPSRGYAYLRPGQELVRIVTPKQAIIDVELEP